MEVTFSGFWHLLLIKGGRGFLFTKFYLKSFNYTLLMSIVITFFALVLFIGW